MLNVECRARYAKILGSAVNPVLREGNSDRRCAGPVKEMAKKQSRRSPPMRAWTPDNGTHVATMTHGDFYGSEQSVIMTSPDTVKIVFRSADGAETLLRAGLGLQQGEVIDASCMSRKALTEFYAAQISDCKSKNLLLSLHLKVQQSSANIQYHSMDFHRPR